jgi:hypothetical protein
MMAMFGQVAQVKVPLDQKAPTVCGEQWAREPGEKPSNSKADFA